MKLLHWTDWAKIRKTAETDVKAESCDLCLQSGAIAALIQRLNDNNNIIIQRIGAPLIQNIRDIAYILTALPAFGIEYIRIESTAGRYIPIFSRYGIKTYPTADKKEVTAGREVRYMKLDSCNILRIWNIINGNLR